MRKHLMLIRATNWHMPFLYHIYQLRRFQNINLWYTFQMLFASKRGLGNTSTLYNKMNLFNIVLNMA